MRAKRLVCAAVGAAALVSCGRKPEAPGPDAAKPAAEAPAEEGTVADEPAEPDPGDVGVGDVVDYAIGKTQLEAKKRIEAQLDDIQKDHERRVKEALGE